MESIPILLIKLQMTEKKESKIQCLHWDNGFIIYYDKSKRICDICKNNLREANKLKVSESVPTASTSKTPLS